jgi:hypothetical protein
MNEEVNLSKKIDRILKLLDKDKQQKWVETISTILLSAATLLSAWCVYESSQWSGEQYFRIDDETRANQFRLQYEIASTQRQTAELQLFLEYASAVSEDNERLKDFLYQRFPPSLKTAFDAWMKLDPKNNPDAPASPFHMKEYILPEEVEAKKYAEQAAEFKKAANESDDNSDNYVLLSLILSTVLFFSGMSGVTDSVKNQWALLSVASLIFLTAVVFIIKMPVVF